MCDTSLPATRGSAAAPPRWGLLYGTAVPQLAALGAVEAMQSPHAIRVALRCVLALGMFATMAMWLRANRPAIDLQDWCDCAGEQMTIRVIESRRSIAVPSPIEPAPLQPVPADEEYEVTAP
jgi:hypothetical protein